MITLTIALAILLIIAILFIFWPLRASKNTMILAVVLIIIMTMGSIGLYAHLGSWNLLQQEKNASNATMINAQIQSMGGEQGVINQLKARLKAHPNDATGWYLLGKIYFSQNHFHQASEAFKKAADLNPEQVELLISVAESQYLSGEDVGNRQTLKYLNQALAIEPHNVAALNLSALIKFKNKNYAKAIALWREILLMVPQDSDTAKAITAAIQRAESLSANQ